MKVLMFYGSFTPRNGGGIASVINNIVKNTCNEIDYTLASYYDPSEREELAELFPSSVNFEFIRIYKDWMRLFLHNGKFDVLHSHSISMIDILPPISRLLSRLNTSIVYSHHIGVEQYIKKGLRQASANFLFNWVSRCWQNTIVNTEYCRLKELKNFKQLKNKIRVIPNGVDIDLVNSVSPFALDGDPSVLFLGHLTPIKGIDLLLKAFNEVFKNHDATQTKLHIVGSHGLENWSRSYVNSNGLSNNVKFWGGVPHKMALQMLRGADILILPSRYENFSITLLEAMAAGKPIITTKVGGTPEFIRERNGILVNPCVSEINEALTSLIDDEHLRRSMAANNVKDVLQYSWKNITPKYVDLYKHLSQ